MGLSDAMRHWVWLSNSNNLFRISSLGGGMVSNYAPAPRVGGIKR